MWIFCIIHFCRHVFQTWIFVSKHSCQLRCYICKHMPQSIFLFYFFNNLILDIKQPHNSDLTFSLCVRDLNHAKYINFIWADWVWCQLSLACLTIYGWDILHRMNEFSRVYDLHIAILIVHHAHLYMASMWCRNKF